MFQFWRKKNLNKLFSVNTKTENEMICRQSCLIIIPYKFQVIVDNKNLVVCFQWIDKVATWLNKGNNSYTKGIGGHFCFAHNSGTNYVIAVILFVLCLDRSRLDIDINFIAAFFITNLYFDKNNLSINIVYFGRVCNTIKTCLGE